MEGADVQADAVNGDQGGQPVQNGGNFLEEEEIGEFKLDDDNILHSSGIGETELRIREEGDEPQDRDEENVGTVTPAGSVSSGEGLVPSPARADSIPNEHEMSVDDEITMETTDPISGDEEPQSFASEIERDTKESEQDLKQQEEGDDRGADHSMDTHQASASRGSYQRTSPTVQTMMGSYLHRERDTDLYDLYLDIPDIEVDSESEEYEFDNDGQSVSDRGVNDLLAALHEQIKWKEDRNLRKARGDLDEPKNTVIRRYNPDYEPPPEYESTRSSTVPRSVPSVPTTGIYQSKYQRRGSIGTSHDLASKYLPPPLSKKLSSSYDSLPRYQPSSTSSSSSSGYSSIGRYGSVDSLSPSRIYRSQSDEPKSSYLSTPSYTSGMGYRSYSSSDISRTTPSYRTSTYNYDVGSQESESESDGERVYSSALAPYRAYRARREGLEVTGPYAKHMSRFSGRGSSNTSSPTTPRRSAATSKKPVKTLENLDERLKEIRANYRKNHKLNFERYDPSSYSSIAGLAVDSEGALSLESSDEERLVSRPPQEPYRTSRRLTQKPFFSLPLRRKTVYDGEPARISCNVQGTPKPRVTWTKNGVPIYDGTHYLITYRWGVAMVELIRASKADTGTFTCTAKNNEGDATTTCELVVEDRLPADESEDYIRPSFAKPLRRVRAKEGRKVRLEVQVMGWPEPKVTWMKDNVRISDLTDHTYVEKFPNGLQTLIIYGVTPTDAGRYQAVASSPAGKATCSADVEVIEVEADVESAGEGEGVGRGRRKSRRVPRPPRPSHIDTTGEAIRSHHRRSRHARDPSSLSPTTYSYESTRTTRKHRDHYTPKTDVLAPSRTRSYSPSSPSGTSPSSRYSPSRGYSPTTYGSPSRYQARPSSPVKSYRPSSPSYYGSLSPSRGYRPSSPTYRPSSPSTYRPSSPSGPYLSYATTKRLASRGGVGDTGVDFYQAGSDRPRRYMDKYESVRKTARESGFVDTTRTSATYTRSGRPLPTPASYSSRYSSTSISRDRSSLDRDRSSLDRDWSPRDIERPTRDIERPPRYQPERYTPEPYKYTPEPYRYTPEPYRPVRDRPVSVPTRIPRRVYRSEEDYYSLRDDVHGYEVEDRYSREYDRYDLEDEPVIRTYAPSAPDVEPIAAEEAPEEIAPDEPEQVGPPTFLRKFQDMSIRDGERVVLEVEISGARPMDVGWLRNGQDIVDCKEFRYVSRGNIYQLEIAEIFPEDSGKYTCEALNDLGEAECSAMLTVNEEPSVSISISQSMDVSFSTDIPCTATIDEDHIPPEFFEEPQSMMVEEGAPARFTCDVDGDPVPSVTWSKDGRPFTDGGRFSIRSDKFTHTFEIIATLSTDAGTYACMARNSEGEVVCEFTLDVLPGAGDGKGITASDVSAARESSKPADTPAEDAAKPSASDASQGSAGSAPVDGGESTTARSESDTDSQEGSVPKFVTSLTDQRASEEDKVVLECQVEGVPMPTVQWFVHEAPIESDKFVFASMDENGVCRLTISEAFTEDSGVYRCQATNAAGTVSTSGKLEIIAKQATPSAPAGKPAVEMSSKSSFKITWTAPSQEGGSPISNYKIEGRKSSESTWSEVGVVAAKSTSYEATGVASETEYVYRVSAQNEAGWGPPGDASDPAVIKEEKESASKPPSNVGKSSVLKDSPFGNKGPGGKGPAPKPTAPPPKRGGGLMDRMAKFSK
ncbi:uncharacterized protein [Diadema antillarum]|uniref:uncharacterized protein isoform X2 n=1 Tax=Diadema antillarum TaxID=105358 RepID=UPI003A8523C9